MPNGFRPRGAPIAEPNSAHDYDGWNLLHRGTMAPWGIYENPQGETASGFAWPAMVTEPLEAGKRFFTPGGGFENNPNPESEKDALTILMSLYGGNALSGVTKGAAARAAEGAPLRVYHGTDAAPFDKFAGHPWFTPEPEFADFYARGKEPVPFPAGARVIPAEIDPKNPYMVPRGKELSDGYAISDAAASARHFGLDPDLAEWPDIENAAKAAGHDFLIHDINDPGGRQLQYQALKSGTVRSPLTGEALFSDTGKPNIMGSALASQWSPEAMAERMRAKMGPQPAPPADPALQELIDLASELPRPPKAEMQPTARGVSSGALGLKPAVSINGNVYSGPNHALAAMDSGLSIEDASTLLSNGELRDGYVTRDGQFLTRKEAEKLIYKNSSSKSSFGLTTKQLQTMEGGRNDSADDILRLYGM